MGNTRDTGFLRNFITRDGSGNVTISGNVSFSGTVSGYATESYVGTQLAALVASAPTTLNTLNELATALGNDPNFATTVTTSIGNKLPLAGGTLTGSLSGTSAIFSSTISATSGSFNGNVRAVNLYNIYKSDNTTLGGQLAFDSTINQLYLWNNISSGYFSIYVNSSERLKIESNGTTTLSGDSIFNSKVGIGTAPGTNRVEIVGIQNEWTLSTTANTTTGQSYGAIIRGGTNSSDIAFRVNNALNNSTYFTINGNGNIGIGTVTPGNYKLNVVGGQYGIYLQGGDMGTGSDVVRMAKSDGSIAMLVRGDGNIGIGTSSPDYKLDVNGTGRFVGSISTGDYLRLTKGTSSDIQAYTGSAYTNLNYDAASHNWQTSGGTAKMVLTSGGNFGLGTTTPTSLPSGGGGIFSVYQSGAASLWLGGSTLSIDGQGTARDLYFYFRYSNTANFQTDSYYRFFINTNEVMRITGAGTTQIKKGDNNDALQIYGSGANSYLFFKSSASIATVGSYTTGVGYLPIYVEGSNVLIGTSTNSGYKLDVAGVTRIQANFEVTGNISTSGNISLAQGANRYIDLGSASNYFWRLRATGDDLEIRMADSFAALKFYYPTGAATFAHSVTSNQGFTVASNLVAGNTTPLHLSYSSSDGNAPAVRLGSGAQGFWDLQPNNNNQELFLEWNDSVKALSVHSNGAVKVSGALKVNRTIYNWYQTGTNNWDGYAYLHIKTGLWGGSGGNNSMPTMSMFSAKIYSYSANYIREGNIGFHNWSGSIYNTSTTGNIWAGAYVSSDGYVVLIVALGSGSYIGVNVDWHQSYAYAFQDRPVLSTAYSNSASSLF